MRLSFHHANPAAGNESFLLRFETLGESACLLVDAGHGTDLDALLRPEDRLVGICLTHAHLDHYSAIAAAHREDVPIYTSPGTAAVLDDVFDVAATEYDVETTDAICEAITPIEEWTAVAPDIEIHPTPAGHVPGAVGFLIRVTEGDETHHLLATGDFTRRDAGGYPGFDADGLPDVDVLFLTAATDDAFERELTDALGTALEHAQRGAPTLVTTSGLVGVQVAALLARLAEEYDVQVPIRVVGQVAKLYEQVGDDSPAVDTVSVFENPRECLSAGAITIAGPEIPCERSSGRLFGVLRDDPNACVVQVVGSGEEPMTDGQCTITDHRVVNHPTRETLVDVHDALQPTSTVITHRHGGASGRFNDLDSVVWGSGDTDEYTLYDGRGWLLPPWMGDGPIRRQRSVEPQRLGQFAGDLLGDPALPSITRRETIDLAAEGLDLERLEERLTRTPAVASVDSPTPAPAASTTVHPPTPSNSMPPDESDESDDTADEDQPQRPPSGLVRTTGSNLGDDVDPAAEAALEETELTADDFATAMAARHHQLRDGEAATDEGSQPNDSGGEAPSTDLDAPEPPSNEQPATESTAESTNGRGPEVDATADSEVTATAPDGGTADTETGPVTVETSDESESTAPEDESTPSEPDSAPVNRSAPPEPRVTLTVHPLIIALAERVIGATDETNRDPLEEILETATDRYLAALLAGDATGGSEEVFDLEVTGSEATERALTVLTERDDQATSIAELACLGLATRLSGETTADEQPVELRVSDRQLDAVVGNDRFAFESRTAVVEAALLHYLNDAMIE